MVLVCVCMCFCGRLCIQACVYMCQYDYMPTLITLLYIRDSLVVTRESHKGHVIKMH